MHKIGILKPTRTRTGTTKTTAATTTTPTTIIITTTTTTTTTMTTTTTIRKTITRIQKSINIYTTIKLSF